MHKLFKYRITKYKLIGFITILVFIFIAIISSWHIANRQGLIPVATTSYAGTCAATGKECRKALLRRINLDRAALGLYPYKLSLVQSRGYGNCVGARGHSRAMAQSGTIWHANPLYPQASFPSDICLPFSEAGENVGSWPATVNKWQAILDIHLEMMNEKSYNGGHYKNLMSSTYRIIGIDVEKANNTYYLTEDFTN